MERVSGVKKLANWIHLQLTNENQNPEPQAGGNHSERKKQNRIYKNNKIILLNIIVIPAE